MDLYIARFLFLVSMILERSKNYSYYFSLLHLPVISWYTYFKIEKVWQIETYFRNRKRYKNSSFFSCILEITIKIMLSKKRFEPYGTWNTLRSRESFNLSTLSGLAISPKPYQIGTTGVMSESLQAKKVEWSSSAFLSFLPLLALVEASCRERNGESNPICLLIRSFVAVIDHDCSQWEGIHDTFNVVLSTVQFVQVFFR